MLRFVRHQDIDPEKWDDAVTTASSPTLFARYDMLDLLTGDAHWHAIVEDDYLAVMPLPYRSKWGIYYIYTPFFLPQMGIYAAQPTDAEKTLMFFNAIPKQFLQVDLLLNHHNTASLLPGKRVNMTSHQLSLNDNYPHLYEKFSQNTRRNIKAAEKQNLTFEKNGALVDEIIRLFRENRGKERAVHYRERDYLNLSRAAERLLQDGLLDVLGVRAAGKLIAGALMVRDGQRIWFWFSGRDENAAECKPVFFLLNEYIKQYCGTGLVFDFNGSNNENVARLYRSFGGVPYPVAMTLFSRFGVVSALKNLFAKK